MPPDNTDTPPLDGEALQAHVTKLLSDHMQDVDKRFSDTMEQLEGLETTFTAKLDLKFKEVLACLPPPPPARAPPPQPTRVAPTPTFVGHAQRVLHQPHKLRLRVLLRALRLLALQELRVLHRPVMHS
jgi:hypothetical protein